MLTSPRTVITEATAAPHPHLRLVPPPSVEVTTPATLDRTQLARAHRIALQWAGSDAAPLSIRTVAAVPALHLNGDWPGWALELAANAADEFAEIGVRVEVAAEAGSEVLHLYPRG
jgi:hypothetical protein